MHESVSLISWKHLSNDSRPDVHFSPPFGALCNHGSIGRVKKNEVFTAFGIQRSKVKMLDVACEVQGNDEVIVLNNAISRNGAAQKQLESDGG